MNGVSEVVAGSDLVAELPSLQHALLIFGCHDPLLIQPGLGMHPDLDQQGRRALLRSSSYKAVTPNRREKRSAATADHRGLPAADCLTLLLVMKRSTSVLCSNHTP